MRFLLWIVLLPAASVAAGFLLDLEPPHVGVMAWLSPALLLGSFVWLRDRKAVRGDLLVLGGLYFVTFFGSWMATALLGLRPRWETVALASLLNLAAAAPAIPLARLLLWLSTRRSSPGHPGVRYVVSLFLALLILSPLVVLSFNLHLAKGTLPLAEAGIDWPHERFTFRGISDTKLVGLWFPHPREQGAVLAVHGIAASKGLVLPAMRGLYEAGYSVFVYDQRDHGESDGYTTTLGEAEKEDLERAWALFLERTGPQEMPRILYGVSLGGAVAQLAAPRLPRLSALILDSTYTSTLDIAKVRVPVLGRIFAPVALLFDRILCGADPIGLEPGRAAGDLPPDLPVLILHAKEDPTIPFDQGKKLASLYGVPAHRMVVFPYRAHARSHLLDPSKFAGALRAFAKEVRTNSRPKPGE